MTELRRLAPCDAAVRAPYIPRIGCTDNPRFVGDDEDEHLIPIHFDLIDVDSGWRLRAMCDERLDAVWICSSSLVGCRLKERAGESNPVPEAYEARGAPARPPDDPPASGAVLLCCAWLGVRVFVGSFPQCWF